ncbi:MAG TPA: transglutaminase domain-containing protein [Candidatus Dormibacteraeota bacterium]|nr:transglutaminase domain-containing protein [Candidatus Dormibacteraeota bacterium]
MQSASPSGRLQLAQERLWDGARSSISGGAIWSALIVFLLTFAIARSTATAAWVNGIEVITLIALLGALLLAVLAVTPIPWPAGLGMGMLLGPVVALIAAGPVLRATHPFDPGLVGDGGVSLQIVSVWWSRITDGSAATDPSFYLFLICWLMWVTGAWLSWCVLRWRKPMLGLIPGAAAFATNLLNVPRDQNGFTLSILVLTLALLLWTNYTGSIASATRAHVKLTGDARWDFWESGLVAMAGLIVLAIMLPPLSTVDRTVDVESSLFSNWAQLQQRLNHPGLVGSGPGGAGTTGFSTDVPLGGPLTRTRDPVFTYTVIGDFTGPRYFRGVNETSTFGAEWRYPNAPGFRQAITKNQVPPYSEQYQKLAIAGVAVKMLRPPVGNADILFYPGELYRVDRNTVATQVQVPTLSASGAIQFGALSSIDRLSSVQPATSAGNYRVTIEYSSATDAELKAAGTGYPAWLRPYSTLPAGGYRSPEVQRRIQDLAVSIVNAAGATNPYDEANAIQNYLRDPRNYTYTLSPPKAPLGVDPLYFFLFQSKQGYCEFFASAMGDMLRSLGIPTRLVNGFGPGAYDSQTNAYVVRGEDAHTWVESYFPGYGWIPFEPTPDSGGGYVPIPRGAQGQTLCLRDENCDPGAVAGGVIGVPVQPTGARGLRNPNDPGPAQSTFQLRAPDAGTLTTVVGIILAIILVLLAAVARYLRPRTVMGVWKRTLALSEMAGAKRRPGETPLELGRRLQDRFPEASEPVGALAGGFVVAAYAPAEVAASARSSVMDAWSALRPLLVRRVLKRLRPNRA